MVSGRDRCSPGLYFVAIVVRYRNRLGATEDHWSEDESLCGLDSADDIAIIDDLWNSMQQTTSALTKEANKVGL